MPTRAAHSNTRSGRPDHAADRAVETFNAHDLDGLADFPDAHVVVRARHAHDQVVVEEGTFCGTHDGVALLMLEQLGLV